MGNEIERIKPLRLTMRLSNNLLIRLRESKGLSAPQAAKLIGVRYNTYLAIENMRSKPYGRRPGFGPVVYDWSPSAKKIASFYGVEPFDLWPADVLAVEKTGATVEASMDELSAALLMSSPPLDPEMSLIAKQSAELVDELSPRMQRVLSARAEGYTLEEIGNDLGLSKERIRTLEARAHGKMISAMKRKERSRTI